MTQPTWTDVKKLLDNPQVPVQDKRSMLEWVGSDQLADNGDQGNFGQEWDEYSKKYHPSSDIDPSGVNFQNAYDHATQSAGDAAQYDGAVRKGLDTLTNIQKKAADAGGAGTGNSNDILDQGEPALVFFDRFSPVYQAVSGRFRKMLSGDTSAKFVRGRYDEQRDIRFGSFAADADAIRKAGRTQQDQTRTMADRLGGLWHGWAGSAGGAAQQSFATLNQGASKVGDDLNGTAQIISDTTHNVSKIVTDKATHVLHSIPDRNCIGGMTPDQAHDVIDVANGDTNDDKIKRACSYFNVHIGAGCDDSYKQQVQSKAGDWVSQVFCPQFEGAFNAVTKICDDTKKAVDDAWKVLTDHLAQTSDDPFAQAQDGRNPGGGPGHGAVGAAGGGGGAAAGGGGGMAAGGGGMPQPGVPGMPGGTGTGPSQPGSVDPSRQGPPQTVTLGSGHDSVTVGQPDQQGHAKVTLTGADGQPKTYDVALGGGQPGMAAPAGAPGQVPAMPAGPNPDGSIPVQAGADGNAVIHDGARTITMDRTPDGQLQISVASGAGQPPVSQTVGFGTADQSGAVPPPPAGPLHPAAEPPMQAQPPVGAQPAGSPQAPPAYHPVDQPLAAQAPGAASTGTAPAGAPVDGGAATFAQAAGFSSTGGLPAAAPDSFASASGQLPHDGTPAGDGQPNAAMTPGAHAGATGLGTMEGVGAGSQQGAVGLQSMADPGSGAQPAPAQPAGAAQDQGGGTTMMGPMGGMGAMGHGGGGQQRSNSSPWRTEGQLFDDGVEASDVRYRSVLGAAEEEDSK
jgi:hypothetical protein